MKCQNTVRRALRIWLSSIVLLNKWFETDCPNLSKLSPPFLKHFCRQNSLSKTFLVAQTIAKKQKKNEKNDQACVGLAWSKPDTRSLDSWYSSDYKARTVCQPSRGWCRLVRQVWNISDFWLVLIVQYFFVTTHILETLTTTKAAPLNAKANRKCIELLVG